MRYTNHTLTFLICTLIISAGSLFGGKLQVRDGRPVVDGVYVNGRGPYRFLIDTGSNVDFIDTRLAASIGLKPTFRTELATATGVTLVPGSDGNEVALGLVKADRQEFLISGLDAIHDSWFDVQGVIGQSFLSEFDYLLDLRNRRLEFGKQEVTGTRARLMKTNGRQSILTSLGDLVLDSATARLTLFGVRPEHVGDRKSEYRSLNGSQKTGFASGKPLVIEGRTIRYGDALAIPSRPELGLAGLLPLGLFKSVYYCNSEGYVVFE